MIQTGRKMVGLNKIMIKFCQQLPSPEKGTKIAWYAFPNPSSSHGCVSKSLEVKMIHKTYSAINHQINTSIIQIKAAFWSVRIMSLHSETNEKNPRSNSKSRIIFLRYDRSNSNILITSL